MAFHRRSTFFSQLKIKVKLSAPSYYYNLVNRQVLAEYDQNLARNRSRHGPHGHDVTKFNKKSKTKVRRTIHHSKLLVSILEISLR
jgi:hypothetical protein